MARILIVEDDRNTQHLLRVILAGHKLIVASDATMGLLPLGRHAVDVVLCSARLLEGVNSWATARTRKLHYAVNIIAMREAQSILAAPFSGLTNLKIVRTIEKPIHALELLQAVGEFVDGARMTTGKR